VADDFTERYGDLINGSYDCVDRVVLNAFFSIGHNPGGFRCWWRRLHGGSDDQLDDAHLMRMAGRFARRVKAWAAANGVPVIFCTSGERKHLIAEQYLEENAVSPGVFLVLAAKAPASVQKVHRSARGVITRLEKKREHVYHYSFHIMDPVFGHLTVKMSGHPPFGAQVILNGHEYVAVAAQAEGIGFTKEGNCFTEIADPQRLARVADAWPRDAAIGRLGQVCDRWIYTACLCFGLDLEEQERSGFRYGYSVYQAEYSRNLLFKSGAQMEDLSGRVLDRTRSRLDIPAIRTLFGLKNRPRRDRKAGPPAQEIVTGEATVRAELVPDQFRAAAAEGLYQGRARPALRGHRAQRQRAALPPQPGQLRPDHRPASRDGGPVRRRPGLRRYRLPARRGAG
jgi:hypothetical protein